MKFLPILLSNVLLFLLLSACEPSASAQEAGSRDSTVSDSENPYPNPLTSMPFDTIATDILLGKFDPAEDSNFVQLQDIHSAGNARGKYLHKDSYEAFIQMYEAAKKDEISLVIKSATRNFYYQKGIWERKWKGITQVGGRNLATTVQDPLERARIILRYSSMPGTSRHHWGTDFDLNAFTNAYFESGKGLKEFQWLQAHASAYGFARPYTAKGESRPYGYEEEKWHWSYLPLAQQYQKSYRTEVGPDMIQGFEGAEVASSLEVIEKYVFGISPKCLEAPKK